MDPKSLIAPLQMWLLKQGRCVGCGRPLSRGEEVQNGQVKVTCECRRVFVWEPKKDSYRRALFSEV